MRTRRSHQKSRNGCASCKKRRIKCDEQGPPCGQCSLRSVDCHYAEPTRPTAAASKRSNASTPTVVAATSPTLAINRDPAVLALAPNSSGSNSRLIELELMHQWSCSTYKTICCSQPLDYPTWQVLIPREALNYGFLLHSMFATSALEISMSPALGQPTKYLTVALEQRHLALSSFRAEISDVTEFNHTAVFAFSLLNMIISLAIPQREGSSMVDCQLLHFNLVRGLQQLTQKSAKWLKNGPLLANHVVPSADISADTLDSSTRRALAQLNELNEERNNLGGHKSQASKLQVVSYHFACRKAILHLEELFVQCADPLHRGYSLAWLVIAGQEYVQAVKDSDPVALVILAHWGVLIDRIGHDIWWAEAAGRCLVSEISSSIPDTGSTLLKSAMAWPQEQISHRGSREPSKTSAK